MDPPDREPAAPHDEEAAARMWQEYVAVHPQVGWDSPAVEHFGDSAAMADELLGFVLGGRKRATAAVLRDFTAAGGLPPRIGSHWVVCDGAGRPRAVLRSVELRLGPAASVDDAFAVDEGEGDRGRDDWLAGHTRYWTRQAEREGWRFDASEPVVFERFHVVWPPDVADRA